ncbi:MAG TPA: hypothetical protein VGB85_18530, partial [Nannocystis sp.]
MTDAAKLKLVSPQGASPEAAEKPAPRKPRSAVDQPLAINGGPAVRRTPLPGPYPGALLMGREEEKG